MNDAEFKDYFTGRKLIGDDFTRSQIDAWFMEEAEGYADLGAKEKESYSYHYFALNHFHGFRHLPPIENANILGFGSAYGDELKPIAQGAKSISIIDPSDHFKVEHLNGVPVNYVKPSPSGALPFANDTFDVATCFGVLHHIPNVTYVVSEIGRVVKPSGYVIIREPTVNMGDWRKPRRGLTSRERGIPVHIMEHALESAGLKILRRSPCAFPVTQRVAKKIGVKQAYNSPFFTFLDWAMCKASEWNYSYDRQGFLNKLCPTSFFWICQKENL